MEILLALGAALSYGASDFVGGVLSKRMAVVVVVLASQVVALVIVLVAAPLWNGGASGAALGWGAAAGVAGGIGASLLYRGLSFGRMSVVAPISGVLAAAIPVLFGLGIGERPGAVALAGVALGIMAVVAVSRAADTAVAGAPPGAGSRAERGILEAVGAGVGFGFFFVFLERSPGDSGLWPLVGTRLSMIAIVAVVAILGRVSRELPERAVSGLVGLGILNVLAEILYLLATRRGLLSLVAVITALYPASTVGLSRWVLHERLTRHQLAGLGLAATSVVLIAWQ